MECKNCNHTLSENALYCDQCGTKVDEENVETVVPKKQYDIKKIIGFGLLFIGLVIVTAFGIDFYNDVEAEREYEKVVAVEFVNDNEFGYFAALTLQGYELLDIEVTKVEPGLFNLEYQFQNDDESTNQKRSACYEVDLYEHTYMRVSCND